MKRARLLLATVFTLLIGSGTVQAIEPTSNSLDVMEKNLADQKAIMVDVREHDETNEGYVAGAILVPLSHLQEGKEAPQFKAVLAQMLPKDKIIYCYCAAGKRSLTAAEIFAGFGYDARSLKQGYGDLVKEGFVVAKPKPE